MAWDFPAAKAFRAGAKGCLLKRAAASELFTAIREVMKGNHHISPLVARNALERLIASVPDAVLGFLPWGWAPMEDPPAAGASSVANRCESMVRSPRDGPAGGRTAEGLHVLSILCSGSEKPLWKSSHDRGRKRGADCSWNIVPGARKRMPASTTIILWGYAHDPSNYRFYDPNLG